MVRMLQGGVELTSLGRLNPKGKEMLLIILQLTIFSLPRTCLFNTVDIMEMNLMLNATSLNFTSTF